MAALISVSVALSQTPAGAAIVESRMRMVKGRGKANTQLSHFGSHYKHQIFSLSSQTAKQTDY